MMASISCSQVVLWTWTNIERSVMILEALLHGANKAENASYDKVSLHHQVDPKAYLDVLSIMVEARGYALHARGCRDPGCWPVCSHVTRYLSTMLCRPPRHSFDCVNGHSLWAPQTSLYSFLEFMRLAFTCGTDPLSTVLSSIPWVNKIGTGGCNDFYGRTARKVA
jgi:hypothetical protein